MNRGEICDTQTNLTDGFNTDRVRLTSLFRLNDRVCQLIEVVVLKQFQTLNIKLNFGS